MDNEYIAQVANFIFDDNLTPDQVTAPVAEVVAKAFHAALTASKAIDLVPRPPGGRPGVVWLMIQGVRAFWRTRGRQRIYTMAKNTAKLKWRSAYEMAKAGI